MGEDSRAEAPQSTYCDGAYSYLVSADVHHNVLVGNRKGGGNQKSRPVALKIVEGKAQFYHEIEMLMKMTNKKQKAKHVVEYYSHFSNANVDGNVIVMEKGQRNLEELLPPNRHGSLDDLLPSDRKQRIIHEVYKGLVEMHDMHLAHLNVCCKNVMEFENEETGKVCKLIGLDTATPFGDTPPLVLMDLENMPPQLAASQLPGSQSFSVDAKVDAWMLGTLTFQIHHPRHQTLYECLLGLGIGDNEVEQDSSDSTDSRIRALANLQFEDVKAVVEENIPDKVKNKAALVDMLVGKNGCLQVDASQRSDLWRLKLFSYLKALDEDGEDTNEVLI